MHPNAPLIAHPRVPLVALDTLWFQVAGTICNIACTHCFISCSPKNHSHEMLSLADVEARLVEARELGVREYYFTGGEPFMNRDMLPILEATLKQGPATVLTNGMLLRPEVCRTLRELFDASEYSLDLRVSLDGFDRESHDAIRGKGVWDRVMIGLRNLAEAGLNPVITVTTAAEGVASAEGRTRFLEIIRAGVIEVGDSVCHQGEILGRVIGFDETHFPNHYNILISSDRLFNADDATLSVEDTITFQL